MLFSEVIKQTRQKAFLSQEEFSKELHVSVSTINRWEQGKVKPNLSALKRIKTFCANNNLPYEDIEQKWFSTNPEDEQ